MCFVINLLYGGIGMIYFLDADICGSVIYGNILMHKGKRYKILSGDSKGDYN